MISREQELLSTIATLLEMALIPLDGFARHNAAFAAERPNTLAVLHECRRLASGESA